MIRPCDHPTGCVECDDAGSPVEGMTMRCVEPFCSDIYCLGHRTRHLARVHEVHEIRSETAE